jgi:hypothetical protein
MRKPKVKGFYIDVQSTTFLTIEELWPDGDAPEDPTERDVRALVDREGGARRVIEDWDLLDCADSFLFTITPKAG